MRRKLIAISLLSTCLAASAMANVVTVHIFNFDFTTDPSHASILDPTIFVGDTIHWVLDEGLHTTTSVAGIPESWNSGTLSTPGASFDHTFTNVGNFQYFCQFHGFDNGNQTAGGMSGVINVQAVPEPATLGVLAVAGLALLRSKRRTSR